MNTVLADLPCLPVPVSMHAPVRMWRCDLRWVPHAHLLNVLTAEESQRAQRFHFDRDRRRYLSAHVTMRLLLAGLDGRDPAHLPLRTCRNGKPYLHGPAQPRFNISHSEDVMLIGVSHEHDIGVDVEVLRPMHEAGALSRTLYTTAEREALALASTAADRDRDFLKVWTRKEACMKAVGLGLSLAPNLFEVGLADEVRDVHLPVGSDGVWVTVQSFQDGDAIGACAWVQPERDVDRRWP